MKKRERIECGGGFRIDCRDMRTWTEYRAFQDDGNGYVAAGRAKNFSRRRDAEAQIEQWRADDEAIYEGSYEYFNRYIAGDR